MSRLTNYEQETIINWNKADDTATLFTYERRIQKRMEQGLGLKPTLINKSGGRGYEFPKKQARLPGIPRKGKVMTDKQKQEASVRLVKARKARQKATA